MGREIRVVPANWEHPKRIVEKSNGQITEEYRPMHGGTTYEEAMDEFRKECETWVTGHRLWQEGFYDGYDGERKTRQQCLIEWAANIKKDRKEKGYSNDYRSAELLRYESGLCDWKDVCGESPHHPDPDDYFPSWPEGVATWFQVYQTVSEGTPVSPPFATREELVDYLVANGDFWDQARRKNGRFGGMDCRPWTREQATRFVFDTGWAPSLIVTHTSSGVEVADGVRSSARNPFNG